MIGWNFPLNHGGEKEGFNNSGIEHFKGVPYDALAREIIQNSLDAIPDGSTKPVHVHFDLHKIDQSLFPGKEDLEEILTSCKEFEPDNEDVQDFFNAALDSIKSKTIHVLKISDYNTTGLKGACDPSKGKNWENLVKSSGSSDKGSGKGGSFGIGKNAPFACSKLRTVFYATKDETGCEAFQGVTRLMTHKNHEGHETRGTGYYGIREGHSPILEMGMLNHFFKRNDVGTDVFIAGFKILGKWKEEIIKSVIENFFVAIHEGKLVVRVDGEQITSSNLPDYLKSDLLSGSDCFAPYYFKSLISPDRHPIVVDDLIGLGKVELHLLQEKGFPKKVAIFRDTGMKIFDKGHFQTPIRFAGVFIARGEDINDFMRKIEPPSHNAWEADRHKNPEYARETIRQIYGWLNDSVRNIAKIDDTEELDVEGISDFLPDDIEELEPDAFDADEGVAANRPKDAPQEVEVQIIAPKPSTSANANADATGEEGEDEGSSLTDGDQPNDGTGGSQPTEPKEGVGSGDDQGLDTSSENGAVPTQTSKPIKLKRVRTFCTDSAKGRYKVLFEPTESGVGTIKIKTIGDDGSVEPAPIESAIACHDGSALVVDSSGKIGPLTFTAGTRNSIEVVLNDALRCAMEVSANAN